LAKHVLGINSAYHESSACLLRDGELLAAAPEERFNRKKHAKPALVTNPDVLPRAAMEFCLRRAGIALSDIDLIGYSLDPHRRLAANTGEPPPAGAPDDSWGTETGEREFFRRTMSIPDKLSGLAGEDLADRVHFIPHHLCHAASAFHLSPFDSAAILVADGIAEFSSTWLGMGTGTAMEPILSIDYPDSLGFLWEKMSEYLGFTEYDACKVMGLASYSEARKTMRQMKEIVRLRSDGTFSVNNEIMRFRTPDFGPLERLFDCERRPPDLHLFAIHENIAASLQRITELALINLASRLHRETQSPNLCLAGGVALNCVANGQILRRSPFENLFVQPAAHDTGTALGAACVLWTEKLGMARPAPQVHDFHGPEYSSEEMEDALRRNRIEYSTLPDVERVTARLLSRGNIVGWFQGKMELGPRALGHRSILADPRSPVIRDELNRRIKFREVFRPFCPSVLEEDAAEWFEVGPETPPPASYMLMACKMKRSRARLIPAVCHVDGTARLQLVSREVDPRYHRLIEEFKRLTEVPILLNTSFNILEPIVCSPQDAINTFLRSDMDNLVLGNHIVERRRGSVSPGRGGVE